MTEPESAQTERLSITVVTVPHPRAQTRDGRPSRPSLEADQLEADQLEADQLEADHYDQPFLRRAAIAFAESRSEATLRERAIHLPLHVLADWCALHLVTPTPGRASTPAIACAHVDPDQEPRVRRLWQQAVLTAPSVIPSLISVLRASEQSLRPAPALGGIGLTQMASDSRGSPAVRLLARCDLAAAVHVPLVAGTRLLGVLTFASATPARYGPRQVALAIAYTSWVASALARFQRRPLAAESVPALASRNGKAVTCWMPLER